MLIGSSSGLKETELSSMCSNAVDLFTRGRTASGQSFDSGAGPNRASRIFSFGIPWNVSKNFVLANHTFPFVMNRCNPGRVQFFCLDWQRFCYELLSGMGAGLMEREA